MNTDQGFAVGVGSVVMSRIFISTNKLVFGRVTYVFSHPFFVCSRHPSSSLVTLQACGSYRRGKSNCGDVDVLIRPPEGQEVRIKKTSQTEFSF